MLPVQGAPEHVNPLKPESHVHFICDTDVHMLWAGQLPAPQAGPLKFEAPHADAVVQ